MKRGHKAFLALLLVAILLVGIYQIALADDTSKSNNPAPKRPLPGQIINELNLSADQVAKIKELRLQFEKDTLQLRNDIKAAELKLRELRQAAAPDLNQINAAIDELYRLRAELAKKEAAHQLAIRAVFTPEQWTKIETYRLFGFGHKGGFPPHGRDHFKERGRSPKEG